MTAHSIKEKRQLGTLEAVTVLHVNHHQPRSITCAWPDHLPLPVLLLFSFLPPPLPSFLPPPFTSPLISPSSPPSPLILLPTFSSSPSSYPSSSLSPPPSLSLSSSPSLSLTLTYSLLPFYPPGYCLSYDMGAYSLQKTCTHYALQQLTHIRTYTQMHIL